jgi:hypothetical protein
LPLQAPRRTRVAALTESTESTRHLVISGTGRAGTSFLVRFLQACGLPTGDGEWFERARAGLEHRLGPGAPYVVKDPSLGLYCDDVDMARVAVDALVLPVRDLQEAAASRLYQEHLGLADTGIARLSNDVGSWTPGGVYASLEPLDVARMLAVMQHRLLRWAARWSMPVVLLDFPRLAQDGEYLVGQLWPYLAPYCDRERALAAFAETADPATSRITSPEAVADPARRALLDRNEELRAELERAQAAILALRRDREHERAANAAELQLALDAAEAASAEAAAQAAARAAAEREASELRAAMEAARAEGERIRAELDVVYGSSSWRVTAPLRGARGALRRPR